MATMAYMAKAMADGYYGIYGKKHGGTKVLHLAACKGHIDVVRFLVELGCPLDDVAGRYSGTQYINLYLYHVYIYYIINLQLKFLYIQY